MVLSNADINIHSRRISQSETNARTNGHGPKKINLFFVLFLIFLFFILILIIISSDFREGNTSLLYTCLMATCALTLRVHLLDLNEKKR